MEEKELSKSETLRGFDGELIALPPLEDYSELEPPQPIDDPDPMYAASKGRLLWMGLFGGWWQGSLWTSGVGGRRGGLMPSLVLMTISGFVLILVIATFGRYGFLPALLFPLTIIFLLFIFGMKELLYSLKVLILYYSKSKS